MVTGHFTELFLTDQSSTRSYVGCKLRKKTIRHKINSFIIRVARLKWHFSYKKVKTFHSILSDKKHVFPFLVTGGQ